MKKTFSYSLTILIVLCFSGLQAQEINSANREYYKHLERADQYLDAMLYAEASIELTKAKQIALENGSESAYISTSISLAEIMRKTGDFSRGFEILTTIPHSDKYPLLHVQKLGRVAALYSEAPLLANIQQLDSVRLYLDSALVIAVKNNFKEEEAGLLNELGYLLNRISINETGPAYVLKAAQIFKELGDEHNYVSAMTNVLKTYAATSQIVKFDSLANQLLLQVEGKKWYSAEVGIYNLLRDVRFSQEDSINGYRYSNAAISAHMSYLVTSNSNKMASFRVLYETQ